MSHFIELVLQTSARQGAGKGAQLPQLSVVKVDEFEGVPAYIRGRLTRDTVNECVAALQAALAAKHKILATPRASLNAATQKKYTALREAETEETKGLFYLTEDEIKMVSEYKMDSSARACIGVLRALGRLKEHRSAGHLRYVVV